DVLVELLSSREVFFFGDKGLLAVQQRCRIPRVVGNIPLARDAVERVRTGPQSQVRLALPVSRIMPASFAWLREIRDLVMFITRLCRPVHEQKELAGLVVRAHVGQTVSADQGVECGPGLHGECVTAEMGNTEADGCVHILFPVLVGEGRTAVDEVDANVPETLTLCHRDTLARLAGVMGAVHPLQIGLEKTLYADAQPVDACAMPFR